MCLIFKDMFWFVNIYHLSELGNFSFWYNSQIINFSIQYYLILYSFIIIIIINVLLFWEFFTLGLADGFSQVFKWQ